jgi:hypothetical protein
MQTFLLLIAIAVGHFFAYVDSRPNWDDTGVLVLMIVVASAILAFLSPRRPWVWSLAVGIWLPLHNFIHNGNLGSLIALAFALVGAYLGAWFRKPFVRAG